MQLEKNWHQNRPVTPNQGLAIKDQSFEILISKKELVAAFGVSSSFVSKLMAEENLPYFKIGRAVRFRISEVSQWLEARKMPCRLSLREDGRNN